MSNEDKQVALQKLPSEMIRIAIDKGADLDKLEKLLELQERYERNEARKAFNTSMVLVQKDIPIVVKDLKNEQTRSKYAGLDSIISKTKEIYTREGFSILFYEGDTGKESHIRICADVIHNLGHKETYHFDVPLDGIGIKGNPNMTAIHAKVSSASYGRRNLMCMIWNIPTADDDGQAACTEYITETQVADLEALISETSADKSKVLQYLSVESLDKIPKALHKKAVAALENRRGK